MSNQIPITFNPDLFLPVFWKLRESDATYNINMGGGASGKSYSTAQHEVIKALEGKEKILVIRKVANTLRDSVIPLVWETVIGKWGLQGDYDYNKSDKQITNKVTGSQMIFRGLDDPDKIKSIEGITRVWVEEADQLTEDDWKILNDRIRGEPVFTLTFNPINENHWLKARFCDVPNDRVLLIKSTYLENPFCGDKYREDMDWYKIHDYEHYRVYGLGQWGRVKTGSEFAPHWQRKDHVQDVRFDEDFPLHISVDQNNLPYSTMTVYQVIPEGATTYIHVIDEYCLKPPNNSTEQGCMDLLYDYGDKVNTIYYYGDATGGNKNQKKNREEALTHYDVIKEVLGEYLVYSSKRVAKKNPLLSIRKKIIQNILTGKGVYRLKVNPRCKEFIDDFECLQEDVNGAYIKTKVLNKKTGQRYEEHGHCMDTFIYFLLGMDKSLFKKQKRYR